MNVNNITIIVFSVMMLSCTTSTKKTTNEIINKQPNIIYILADDLGYGEIGALGQTKIETPNIDALAKNGMLFTQHYAGAPVCAPSRAVLLTGKHTGHTPIRGNDEWTERGDVWNYKATIKDSLLEGQRPLPENTITIPKLLKTKGYKTAVVGKWGLGAPHTNAIPTKMGFDYFFGYNCQRQAHTYTPVHIYENENRVYLKNDTIAPHTGVDLDDKLNDAAYTKFNQPEYVPTLIYDKLIHFIDTHKKEPFFLYWASPIPHVPLQAPKKWVDYYVEKFGDEQPYYFKGRGNYYPSRYPRATYAAMVSYLDENIGKLVNHLKKEGIYDNTLIIFTSDNGPSYAGGTDSKWFNSGGIFDSDYGKGKGFLQEGGIRVPMIASWPNKIKAGTKTNHISSFYDVLQTFNDVANVNSDYKNDGISFYNTLLGKEQKAHEYLYWEFPEYNGQVAIRMGKWKFLWKNIKKGNKDIELYNLEKDIKEKNNVAENHPDLIHQFFNIIKKEHKTPANKVFVIEELENIINEK